MTDDLRLSRTIISAGDAPTPEFRAALRERLADEAAGHMIVPIGGASRRTSGAPPRRSRWLVLGVATAAMALLVTGLVLATRRDGTAPVAQPDVYDGLRDIAHQRLVNVATTHDGVDVPRPDGIVATLRFEPIDPATGEMEVTGDDTCTRLSGTVVVDRRGKITGSEFASPDEDCPEWSIMPSGVLRPIDGGVEMTSPDGHTLYRFISIEAMERYVPPVDGWDGTYVADGTDVLFEIAPGPALAFGACRADVQADTDGFLSVRDGVSCSADGVYGIVLDGLLGGSLRIVRHHGVLYADTTNDTVLLRPAYTSSATPPDTNDPLLRRSTASLPEGSSRETTTGVVHISDGCVTIQSTSVVLSAPGPTDTAPTGSPTRNSWTPIWPPDTVWGSDGTIRLGEVEFAAGAIVDLTGGIPPFGFDVANEAVGSEAAIDCLMSSGVGFQVESVEVRRAAADGPVGRFVDAASNRTFVLLPTSFDDQIDRPYLAFGDAGDPELPIEGFSGCTSFFGRGSWVADDDGSVSLDGSITVGTAGCSPGLDAITITNDTRFLASADELQVTTGATTWTFVPTDGLPIPRSERLDGRWRAGDDGVLLVDGAGSGRMRLGDCSTTFALDGSLLTTGGWGADDCVGSELSLSRVLETSDFEGSFRQVHMSDDVLIIEARSAKRRPLVFALRWIGPLTDSDTISFEAGSAFGYLPADSVTADEIEAHVSSILGPPTHDTGWFVTPDDPTIVDHEDCMGGNTTRVLWWHDLSFVVWQFPDGSELLFAWSVGDILATRFGDRREPYLPEPGDRSNVTSDDDPPIGIGSTGDEVLAAYPDTLQASIDFAEPNDRKQRWQVGPVTIILLDGRVIGFGNEVYFC